MGYPSSLNSGPKDRPRPGQSGHPAFRECALDIRVQDWERWGAAGASILPSMESTPLNARAYALPQPPDMAPDLFLSGALDLDADAGPWIPQSPGVSFRPLILN